MNQNTERFRATLERIQAGDEMAFKELYTAISGKVFSYIIPRVRDRDAALDILQDIFVAVWAARLRFSYINDASVYGFVFTIARRQLAAYYAKNTRTKEIEARAEDERYDMDIDALGDIHTVERALPQLSEADQNIITLRYWSGFSFAEIAGMVDSNENAVRVQHHRALEKLKTIINHHD